MSAKVFYVQVLRVLFCIVIIKFCVRSSRHCFFSFFLFFFLSFKDNFCILLPHSLLKSPHSYG